MLVIDDRENEKVIHKVLMRLRDADQDEKGQAKVRRLKSADYVIGEWGIEAKEVNDLYRSILGIGRSRTIHDQLRDLEDSFAVPMLVVYGTKLKPYIPGRKPTAQTMAIEMARMKKTNQQFKQTLYSRFPKIRYMEFLDMNEFVDFLVSSHTQMQITGAAQQAAKHRKAPTDPRVVALSSLRGITPVMAEGVLQQFGSLKHLLRSATTQKQLMEIDGITRDKARAILSLRERV